MVRRSVQAPDDELGLMPGTLDLFILKTLSWGPMHGLSILQWIERTSQRRQQVEEGALYPALHRMEGKGWLEAEWGHTDAGRRAKYYRLTREGRKQLATKVARWSAYTEIVALILSAKEAG